MSAAERLSVVIPTHGRRATLALVLAALGEQTLPPAAFDVIVSIDGDGDAPTTPLPYALQVQRGPRGGPGAARNRGAALARGAVLVFLDDDIVPGPACLAEHLAVHAGAGPRVGLGRVDLAAPAARPPWERYLTARYDEHFDKMARPGYAPTFWDCLSGSLSVPRALYARSGGFDEGLPRHEDVELGYRLGRLGAGFVYRPQAQGLHLYTRGLEGGLGDALGEGATAGTLVRRYPDMIGGLLHKRWRRYGPNGRRVLRWVLADEARHAAARTQARRWLGRVDAAALPYWARRPVYQWVYHLHFWHGLRGTAPELLPLVVGA